ncbi:hypothetical protein AB0C52_13145 [Streptomyces sp. NPDC048717]|uniref:hypothetical protein n=1 Tax=Streptomyces sp. NPDC048717 TaxID=3154928 RepID=UPI003433056D
MSEGLQAGRLDVPVVADLSGFARTLRTKVEAVAEGLAVKVKIKVDAKNLRRKFDAAVKEASKGLTAKVKIKVDDRRLRTDLDAVSRQVARTDIRVPVTADGEHDGERHGGLLAGTRSLIESAQGEADRTPVDVPVRMRMPRGRGSLRMLAIGGIVSVLQPAIGALTQYGGAAVALASSMAPAVGVLGAVPGLIAAAGTAAIGTKVAFGGFGEALKQAFKAQSQLAAGAKLTTAQQQALDQSVQGLSGSARQSVKTVVSLSGAWRTMRQSVQEQFFSKVAGEIRPLSSSVLPLLRDSLGDSAAQMGQLAQRGARVMQTGVFRSDFKTIAGTNSRVIGSLTGGLGNLGRATVDFLVASGPFVERVSAAGERLTRWVRASAAAGRSTGSLGRFFDHAAEKAKQLGRTTRYLGEGLAGMGRAGMDAGDALFDGLEGTMLRFSRWANSGEGKKSMQQFFSDAAPTFHELNMLVGDLGRGLARMSRDNGITDLVRQIRTELMPGIGAALDSLGRSVGPAVIGIVSNLARAVATLSAAGSGLGVLLASFNGLLNIFNGLMHVVPGLGTGLGILLGTMMAFKVVRGVTSALTGMAASMRTLGAASSVTTGAMGPQLSLWQRVRSTYTATAAEAGRMTGAMRATGAVAGALRGSVSGLLGALGGPWGAAIAAVTIGVGLLAGQHEKAARAAQAQESRVSSLTQALRDSNGAIDANVRARAAQLLQETKLADGETALVDRMREAGVSLKRLTDAYLGQGGSLKGLQKELQATADGHKTMIVTAAGAAQAWDDEGLAAIRAKDALGEVSGDLTKSLRGYRELTDASKAAGSAGTDSFSRLKTAVEGMSSSTATADDRVNSLKRALDALTGGSESFHAAQTRVNAAILSVNDAIEANTGRLKDASKELIGYDGSVNTATKNGQQFNAHLTELRDSAAGAAVAAFDVAKATGTPLADALKTGQGEMTKAREAAIAYGRDLGLTKEQAAGLADKMGLMPSTVSILLSAKGIPEANAEILGLQAQLGSLPAGKSVTVKAPNGEAIAALRAVGFEVTKMPGGKTVTVTAPTGGARGQLAMLVDAIAATPANKNVSVKALIKTAAADLTAVRDKVVDLPAGKTLKLEAPTKLAQEELKKLGFRVREVPGSKKVEVTAPTGSAISNVQALQQKINSLTGKTVTVTVRHSTLGKPYVSEHADGGIVKYADGGIRWAANRVKAFAAGSERHVAQIARAGEMRLWAEPETWPGEAYIPLAPSKRKRSEEILGTVAKYFGGSVVYPGRGVQQYADGAVRLHQAAARSATAPRAAPVAAAPALVGGDLNLTMSSATTAGEALNDALFELRRIRRGGAYVSS